MSDNLGILGKWKEKPSRKVKPYDKQNKVKQNWEPNNNYVLVCKEANV
jgi:hypothetical protein